jgi:hypothetical protein
MNEDGAATVGDWCDPRMRGFKTRISTQELTVWIVEQVNALESEEICRLPICQS